MEKAVDIDTIPGMNVDVDNDFLDYLRKSMISGLGIPSNYLNYNDEVEFAKSLSMVNAKFIRTIIVMQKLLSPVFTDYVQTLYRNEYANNYSDKNKLEQIVNLIEVCFPSPGSLNMTNINEQIGNVQQVAQYISTTLVGENSTSDDDSQLKDLLILDISKDLLPNLDWNKYESMMKEKKLELAKQKVDNSDDEENDYGSQDNDYGDEENTDDMGMGTEDDMNMETGEDMDMGNDVNEPETTTAGNEANASDKTNDQNDVKNDSQI